MGPEGTGGERRGGKGGKVREMRVSKVTPSKNPRSATVLIISTERAASRSTAVYQCKLQAAGSIVHCDTKRSWDWGRGQRTYSGPCWQSCRVQRPQRRCTFRHTCTAASCPRDEAANPLNRCCRHHRGLSRNHSRSQSLDTTL